MKRYIKLTDSIDLTHAFDVDPAIRGRIAGSTNDPALMDVYLYDPSELVRCKLVRNPKVTIEILNILAKDEQSSVRTAVASNRKAAKDIDIMTMLSQDSSNAVRFTVAQWCRFPEILVKLYNDSTLLVKDGVLSNPNTPEFVLRQAMADNPRSKNNRGNTLYNAARDNLKARGLSV